MAMPYYRVNGTDILPLLLEGGFQWAEEDIDQENSGRTTMDGEMHRAVVARKDKHTLSFRELSMDEARSVTSAFNTNFVTVQTNIHPKRSGAVSLVMYNSSRKAAVHYLDEDGNSSWRFEDISIIER